MFGILTLCLKLSIYTGAMLTVVACTLIGPEIIAGLSLPEGIAYGIGAVLGVFSASILFGMPIVLLTKTGVRVNFLPQAT